MAENCRTKNELPYRQKRVVLYIVNDKKRYCFKNKVVNKDLWVKNALHKEHEMSELPKCL